MQTNKQKRSVIHNCFCLGRGWVHTLSMLAGFRRIIEVCASRVKTVRRARWEYRSCGCKSSSRKALLNIVATISFITTERAWERWVRKRETLRQESKLKYPTERNRKNLLKFELWKWFYQLIVGLVMKYRHYINLNFG